MLRYVYCVMLRYVKCLINYMFMYYAQVYGISSKYS